jgi:hypothetical protein
MVDAEEEEEEEEEEEHKSIFALRAPSQYIIINMSNRLRTFLMLKQRRPSQYLIVVSIP